MSKSYDIPAYSWAPRPYQLPLWQYLQRGGKHAEEIAHRRWGKDEVLMQHAAICTFERTGTYWHMLPLQTQVRKAIWKAVNPHTSRRRIEDAFPEKYFKHNDSEMLVTNRTTGSTWQCIGSDNFQGVIGSPPVGIVYSEWALANPYARAYLRPILAENNGWQAFITTPRGKNHAYNSFMNAKKDPDAFTEVCDVYQTGVIGPEELLKILIEYKDLYGEENGLALYQQEFECSFEAALIGTYYGSEFKSIDKEGRIKRVEHNPDWPVHCAMDIGRNDATCIWFWQNIHGRNYIIDMWVESGRDPDWVAGVISGKQTSINIIGNPHDGGSKIEVEYGGDMPDFRHHQEYEIGSIWIPHDGAAKTFVAKGKTVHEQLASVFGWGKVKVCPNLSVQDGIQSSRYFLNNCEIDERVDVEGMRQYRREWDDTMRRFKDRPLHDWCSDVADGWRYMAIANRHDTIPKSLEKTKYPLDRTFMEMVKANTKRRKRASS